MSYASDLEAADLEQQQELQRARIGRFTTQLASALGNTKLDDSNWDSVERGSGLGVAQVERRHKNELDAQNRRMQLEDRRMSIEDRSAGRDVQRQQLQMAKDKAQRETEERDPNHPKNVAYRDFLAKTMPEYFGALPDEIKNGLTRADHDLFLKPAELKEKLQTQKQIASDRNRNQVLILDRGNQYKTDSREDTQAFTDEQARKRAEDQKNAITIKADAAAKAKTEAGPKESDVRGWSGKIPDGTRASIDAIGKAEQAVADMGGLDKVSGVGFIAGALPQGALDKKSIEFRSQSRLAAAFVKKNLYGASFTEGEKADFNKAIALAEGGRTEKEVAQGLKMLKQLAHSSVNQALSGAHPEIKKRILTDYGLQPPDQTGGGDQPISPVRAGEVKKQYSPSRNKTRITYPDGRVEILDGRR